MSGDRPGGASPPAAGAPPGASPGHPSPLRRALGRPPFRRLLAAHTVSRWGDTFNSVAMVVIVYRLTGSGLAVAATVGLEIAAVLTFGLLAGAVADRVPRRRVMVAADLGRGALALALVAGHRSLGVLLVGAFGLAALSTFFNPAAASLVPATVGADDEVVGANSALWSAAVLSQIALAPAAGALVAWAGPAPAFAVNAASFAVSAALLRGLAVGAAPTGGETGGTVAARLGEGYRVVRGSGLLSRLALVQALAALSAGATSALLVVLAQDHLDVGPARFGVLLGAIGVGAGLGPLVLQRLAPEVSRRRYLFGPHLARGLVDLTLASTADFRVAAGALGAYGVATSTGQVAYQTTLHRRVADHVRGRVFAFFDVVWQASRLVSLAVGGWLADAVGVRAVFVAGGAVLLVAGAVGLAGPDGRGGGALWGAGGPGQTGPEMEGRP